MTLDFSYLGYADDTEVLVFDAFLNQTLGTFMGSLQLTVPLHGVRALRVTPTQAERRDTTWRPWRS